MSYPNRRDATQICVTVTKEGVKLYGNRDAFRSLAEWMTRLADSPEGEYYECHVTWQLESEASFFGKEQKDVWVLFDKEAAQVFRRPSPGDTGFDLDFMAVEKKDLENLRQFQATGLLPDDWNKQKD